jgi:hypothetical protein
MTVEVQCYAGRKADERPVRSWIVDRDHLVEEIVEEWYGPDASFYKVRADHHGLYLLRHEMSAELWEVESIRKVG